MSPVVGFQVDWRVDHTALSPRPFKSVDRFLQNPTVTTCHLRPHRLRTVGNDDVCQFRVLKLLVIMRNACWCNAVVECFFYWVAGKFRFPRNAVESLGIYCVLLIVIDISTVILITIKVSRWSSHLERAVKAQRRNRGIAYSFFNLGSRLGGGDGWSAPRPGRFTFGNAPVPILTMIS